MNKELQKTVTKLEPNEDRFRYLFDAVFECLIVHDTARLLDANASFLEVAHKNLHEIQGLELRALFPASFVEALQIPFLEAPFVAHLPLNGTDYVYEARTRAFLHKGEAVYLLAMRNITTQFQLEDQLQKANAELERRVEQRTEALQRCNQELELFASIVAHDLQAPLSTITAQLKSACEEGELQNDDSLASHFVDRAIKNAVGLQGLIHSVLEYARIGVDTHKLDPVDLEKVVLDVKESLARDIKRNEAVIVTHDLPEVCGCRELLHELLQNLIGNALRYRRQQPPRIEIYSVASPNHNAHICVRDNGKGIQAEEVDRIFRIFYQSAAGDGIRGNGIGLAFCKKIVESHGGELWAESTVGVGTTMHFTLPKHDT